MSDAYKPTRTGYDGAIMFLTQAWQDLLYPGKAEDYFLRFGQNKFPPFEPNATGYSRANALWLMELSRLVYRHDKEENSPPPQPTRDSFLDSAGFKLVRFFQHKSEDIDTQAMLAKFSQLDYAVLAFRGTEQNTGDFKTDLKVWKDFIAALESATRPSDENTIHMHQGFVDALNSVWGDIETELATLKCPVFYTGHSLGAALATLAAAKRPPKAVYTFGSPRVGNKAFANSLTDTLIYRVVDDEDIVTAVPPEEILGVRTGFVHVGTEHLLREKSSAFTWLKHLMPPPKPLADHAPVNYVDRLYKELA